MLKVAGLTIVTLFIMCLVVLISYMVINGAINYDRIENCKKYSGFCGLQIIDLSIPKSLNMQILDAVESGAGKRVVIPAWKAGRTISTSYVAENMPSVLNWYVSLESYISSIIGERVFVTSNSLPTTCAILVYEKDGDFINWHYDVNYFKGRFFTLLIPCTVVNSCTQYTYINADKQLVGISEEHGKSILFEGDKVFHMATKFCNRSKKRIILSVQFSTDPTITLYNQSLMRIKDMAYIGY